jgi:hypothetical protein
MMDNCNARALAPLRKSSIAVLSPRLFLKTKPFGDNVEDKMTGGREEG